MRTLHQQEPPLCGKDGGMWYKIAHLQGSTYVATIKSYVCNNTCDSQKIMLAMLFQAYGFAMRGGMVAFAAPSLWVYRGSSACAYSTIVSLLDLINIGIENWE